jgi:signal transduction histidine kinase
MPQAVVDVQNNGFFSPSEEICAFMGRTAEELADLKGWAKGFSRLAEQINNNDRSPRFVDMIKNGKPFHLGVFPLDFINLEKTLLSVFLFDAESEMKRKAANESISQGAAVLAGYSRNMLILSGDGLVLAASDDLLKFWKFNPADIIGKPFIFMLASSDKLEVQKKLLSSAYFSEEILCLRGNGSQFKAALTAERRVIRRKQYITVKISGEELQEEESAVLERYSLLNFIPAMAAIGDAVNLFYANKAFLDFFGCANLGDFFNRYERLERLFIPRKGYIHSKSGDWLSQAEYYLKNNSTVKVLLFSPLENEYRTFSFIFKQIPNTGRFIFVFMDITDIDSRHFVLQDVNQALEQVVEKKSIEKQQAAMLLKKQEELLVQQSKLATMGNMVNIITHQWKQPLSTMRILSYNLLEDHKDGLINRDKLDKYVKETTAQIEYMAETIDDFRNFFKPSKKLAGFEPAEPVKSVLRLLKPMLASSGIKLVFSEGENIPQALGLPNELKQVLMGLVINSVEALTDRRRQKTVQGEISIDISADDIDIYINVEDNGGGIEPEMMAKIFEPNVTTKSDKGTGVGLYISKVAMANMNGQISVHNGEKGAVFTLTLKRVKNKL